MEVDIEKIKGLASFYMLLLILGASYFTIFIDYKALKKKKLDREAKICRIMGYGCLIIGLGFFIVGRYVI